MRNVRAPCKLKQGCWVRVIAGLGMLYGPWLGGLIGGLGSVLAGLVAFGLGRTLGRPALRVLCGDADLDRLANFVSPEELEDDGSLDDRLPYVEDDLYDRLVDHLAEFCRRWPEPIPFTPDPKQRR